METLVDKKEASNRTHSRIESFHILRIILCVAVIALHCNVFSVAKQYVGTDTNNPLFYRILLYNLFWACVPCFYVLSFFLYMLKREQNPGYFKKRIKRLTILYVFWMCFEHIIINNGVIVKSSVGVWDIFCFISSHNNIAYFIFNLCWLVCLLELYIRIRDKINPIFHCVGAVASLLLMFFSQGLLNRIGCIGSSDFMLGNKLGFSNPFLFLPYIYMGAFVYDVFTRHFDKIKQTVCILCALWVLFALADWCLRGRLEIFSWNYESLGRPSLVFEAGAIILLFTMAKDKHFPKIFETLSSYTLGVYFIHPIVLNYVIYNLNALGRSLKGSMVFVIVTFVSFFAVGVMKKVKYLL